MQNTVRFNHQIEEDDYITSLELRNNDDSEPEQLVVDGTLEDVLVRRGDKKQLVAVVKSIETFPIGTGNGSREAQPAQRAPIDVELTNVSFSSEGHTGSS